MTLYKLYKFREVNTNSLASLANYEVWFSSKEDFNDPFEGTLVIDETLTKSDYKLWDSLVSWKHNLTPDDKQFVELCRDLDLNPRNFTKEELILKGLRYDLGVLTQIVHKSKFLCLSLKDEEHDPLYNNLMWSHYAQGLRGFCLVFNNEKLQDDINVASNKRMRGIRVDYKDEPNKLSLADYMRSDSWTNIDKLNYIQKVTETVATKSTAWKYENEMRIITLESDISSYKFSPETLEGIVLGDKMLSQHQELILAIVKSKYPHIKVQRARLIPSTYKIEIVPFVDSTTISL
ncbi:DUF2971 domain-containing protein [Vibrio sp. A1-b2]|uniref:DUF2971 domain-containing protein n=1 Tax=Vibrio sp. A1-b2 TaxID=2912248 RepID=UPI001F3E5CA1|nr:DUF2971 domain-containing protein [Vibrio sp. A1-b2]MCF7363585.1 DUF2971 domain-containing protein [Vibrio sp. A1-b2]